MHVDNAGFTRDITFGKMDKSNIAAVMLKNLVGRP